jgi:hypothetical protein
MNDATGSHGKIQPDDKNHNQLEADALGFQFRPDAH